MISEITGVSVSSAEEDGGGAERCFGHQRRNRAAVSRAGHAGWFCVRRGLVCCWNMGGGRSGTFHSIDLIDRSGAAGVAFIKLVKYETCRRHVTDQYGTVDPTRAALYLSTVSVDSLFSCFLSATVLADIFTASYRSTLMAPGCCNNWVSWSERLTGLNLV